MTEPRPAGPATPWRVGLAALLTLVGLAGVVMAGVFMADAVWLTAIAALALLLGALACGRLWAAPRRAGVPAPTHELSGRLSLALQAGYLGVWELSSDGKAFTVDPRVAEIYGLPPDQRVVPLKLWLQAIHPDDWPQVRSSYEALKRGQSDYQVAYRIYRQDGRLRWVRSAVTAVRGPDGALLRVVGMDQDITDTMEAQQDLLAANQRLRLALQMAHASVWEVDAKRRMRWDQHGDDLYGVDLRADPQAWRGRVLPEDRHVLGQWDRHLGDPALKEIKLEYRIQHPKRGLRYIRIVGQVERDVSGRLLRATGIDMDITPQREASARIQELTDRLAVAAQASGMGIWQYVPDTGELWWDRQQYILHGMSEASFAPTLQAWKALCHAGDEARLTAMIDRCRRTRQTGHCEIRILDTAGGTWVLRLVCQPIVDARRGLLQLVGATFDVTAEREASAEGERARQAAEAASRAKSAFLANMSHEIRTPMNAVLGMTQLALDAGVSEPAHTYVARAHRSATDLLAILNDVLDLSKIEAGKITLENRDFDLDALLENVLATVQDAAQHKAISLRLQRKPQRLGHWHGDALRLRQVLLNLLSNAVKFTDEGGVTLCVAPDPDHDGRMRFEVSDTGIGMSAEQQSRVFDAFEQADISTSRRFGGTGLGLTICRQIVGLMGGEIGVRSQLGQGSVFWFSYPQLSPARDAADAGHAASDAAVGTGSPLHGRHVLLVEDNPVNQELATLILQRQGLEVSTASSGDEALQRLQHQVPDLILMDIQMPGMDGLEATRRIRAMGGVLAHLPIVAMTANALTGDREASLEAGMNDHITKPVDVAVLREVLGRWMGAVDGGHPASPR